MVDPKTNSSPKSAPKKLLESPFIGGLVVPIAIVVIGAAIIFGVTKMLSTERSYKDLVREMHSKTFGNRWIAAYELSKLISTKQIPAEDLPWLVENLEQIYRDTTDERTKEFLVVAAGALKTPLVIPLLEAALSSSNSSIQFHGLVALGNAPKTEKVKWESHVLPFLKSEDHGLRQAAILALASHRVQLANKSIEAALSDKNDGVRYAAATALVYYQNPSALPVLKEILELKEIEAQPAEAGYGKDGFNGQQMGNLKLNIIKALAVTKWDQLSLLVKDAMQNEQNQKVLLYEQQVLNKLKN